MEDDQIQNPGTAQPTGTDTPAASATPTPAQPASAQPAQTPAVTPAVPAAQPAAPVTEPKVLTIPTHAMKSIKAEERERGKAEAMQALDAEAQSLGFANYAELKAFAGQQKAQPQAQPAAQDPAQQQQKPAQQPQAKGEPNAAETLRKLEQERDKALEDKKRLNRIRAREEREKKELQRKLNEMEVAMELKLAAKDAGVVDVDYAVEVLKRAIKGMSEDDLKGFDESKFFRETLRQSHPHLYQVEQRPVTTGTPSVPTSKPAPATPAATQTKQNENVDARKLPPHEFQALLRKRGLSDPATGGMMS